MNDRIKHRRAAVKRLGGVKDVRQPALAPGVLVHVGEQHVERTTIQLFCYDDHNVEERSMESVSECLEVIKTSEVRRYWLRVTGLHDVEKVGALLAGLEIHPLVQEDILNTNHRPKIEEFSGQIFLTLKSFTATGFAAGIAGEQISMLMTEGLVLTFQESESPIFSPVIDRLKTGSGRLRRNGSDYLIWGLMDAIVDNYFVSLAAVEDDIDLLDDQLVREPSSMDINEIHSIKAQVLSVAKVLAYSEDHLCYDEE